MQRRNLLLTVAALSLPAVRIRAALQRADLAKWAKPVKAPGFQAD